MSQSAIKDIRKQVRNVVQENLKDLLTTELYNKLLEEINKKLKKIEEDVKNTLHEINTRHKDTMSYLVRQATTHTDKGGKNE